MKKALPNSMLFLTAAFIFLSFASHGQQRVIAGTVEEAENKTPLAGASVSVQGKDSSTVTDAGGRFRLTIPTQTTSLVISYVGFETHIIAIRENETNVTIHLTRTDASKLSDVIVVGYGTQKKINLTGAVGVVDTKMLQDRPVTNAYQALQGVSPGLNLTVNGRSGELGGSYNVNIRGYTSINGGSPLVLIDGVRSSLDALNTDDIESISVLKDQASSAIYGAQAAYGVLIITTKKGKAGKVLMNYTNNFSNRSPISMPKNMSSLEFATMYNTSTANDNIPNIFSPDDIERIKAYLADPGHAPVSIPNPAQPNVWGKHNLSSANTDWYSTIYKQNVFNQLHNLNAGGGNENIRYYMSGSYLQQDGMLRYGDDRYDKYTINGNVDGKINNWLRFNFIAQYTSDKLERPAFDPATLYADLSVRWPNNYIRDPNGYYSNFSHILKLTTGGRYNRTSELYTTTGGLVIEPVKNWVTNVTLTRRNNFVKFDDTQIPVWEHGVDLTPVNVQGLTSYETEKSDNNYITASIYSAYEKNIAGHYFKAMAGWQYENNKYSMVNGMRQMLVVNEVPSLSSASGNQFARDNQYEWANTGYFGRLNYNYKNKYLLEINVRADGSSRFREGSRWGAFPSISGGYVLSEENYWMKLSKVINFFKIRASYGKLGNQSFSTGTINEQFYPYVPVIPINLTSGWIFGSDERISTRASGLVYPGLTWETVKGWNIGFTATSLNGRLSADFDIYRRITEDMIGPVADLPAILGTAAPRANNATLATSGYEILVTWKDHVGQFNYSVSANLSDYRSGILDYNNPTMLNSTYYNGHKIGEIWGYVTEGIFQSQDEVDKAANQTKISAQPWRPGDIRYKDLNGDGIIDFGNNTVSNAGDRAIIGNNTPRFSYGFNVTCSWKGIDFSMFWQGVGKRDLFISTSNFWGIRAGQFASSGFVQHLDYWTPEHTDAYYPRPLMSTYAKNQQTQSRYILDASYVRLKSLQLGYSFPHKTFGADFLKKLRLYIAGENLFTITNIPGQFDPEVENSGRSYPLQKVLSAGLNLNL